MRSFISSIVLTLVGVSALAAQEPNEAIHEELRRLLTGIETAVNNGAYDDLAPYFHENMRVTTINQEIISSPGDIRGYFDSWFGPGGFLKKIDMQLVADELTELYGDNTFGIVRGYGEEDYILSDERFFPMKTRWTATVIKDIDGQWRILALHIGTNFLDNPILAAAEGALMNFGAGGLLIGVVIGGLAGFLFGRRTRKAQ